MTDQYISISGLSLSQPLTGSEVLPMDQGPSTVQATAQQIANLAPKTDLGYIPATRTLTSSTGEDIEIPEASAIASGLLPAAWISGASPALFPHIDGNLNGIVYENVRNNSGTVMPALTPYHIVGNQGNTDRVLIVPAKASDPSTMPASGILPMELAASGTAADGLGAISGVVMGVNSGAWFSGSGLYVAPAGGVTDVRPTENAQLVAVVGRSHASTGSIIPLLGPSLSRVAYTGDYNHLANKPTLGSAAAQDASAFATAAQGAKADSAVQPGSLGNAATRNVGTAVGTVAAGDDSRFIALSSTAPSNLAATAAAGTGAQAARSDHIHQFQSADVIIPLSGETQSLATGIAVTISRWPRNHVLTAIPLWMVNTASVGAALQLDIRVGGTSIFATLPTIDATEQGSDTAAVSAVFSTAFTSGGQLIAQNSVVTFHVLQIGTTTAGAGLKVALPVRRAA